VVGNLSEGSYLEMHLTVVEGVEVICGVSGIKKGLHQVVVVFWSGGTDQGSCRWIVPST